uniref:Uncharacterized protein n=1 Tax=Oryctolagus cuniculus TaxID=9986 RepID=G1TC20_RABIT
MFMPVVLSLMAPLYIYRDQAIRTMSTVQPYSHLSYFSLSLCLLAPATPHPAPVCTHIFKHSFASTQTSQKTYSLFHFSSDWILSIPLLFLFESESRNQRTKYTGSYKFQQKAVKQTKQKKSKSAEFLMVKEDREAMEGTGNPAFNMSSPDLSAYQTSQKNVIRCDSPARTLAAHPQEFRLLASAEPKGNEYSRNYFDPLMDEEINPRQCGMEVSREGDDAILYNRLMKLFDDSRQGEPQDGSTREETLDSEAPKSSKNQEIYKEADEATPSYIEEFEKYAQKDVILLGSSALQQDLKFEGEGLISTSQLKTDGTFGKYVP